VSAASEEVTLDRLSGEWWIYQLRAGHRYATDDVLVAWTAYRAQPRATRLVDLGAGVGSVGLMTLQLLPPGARLTSIEQLEVSVGLARRTVALNGLSERVDVRLGDLRDTSAFGPDERFELVTANPPYLPLGHGPRPPHFQRRAARFELSGDVFDYCRAAARLLAPGGRFCFCHPAGDGRGVEAVAQAGLHLIQSRQVVFRQGRPPQLALYICGDEGAGDRLDALCVRDARGVRTPEYVQVLREMAIAE
jgi:tRNA1(Val) A37 N6-methylase TrmN6